MSENPKMHRWSADHPLPIHINDGPLRSFLIICPNKPPKAQSTAGVEVTITQNGKEWILSFTLLDTRFENVFVSLYQEICEKCWNASAEQAGAIFVDTYNTWKDTFSKKRVELSKIEVQGLIGELLCIRDIFSEKYTPEEILNSWSILDKGRQDFTMSEEWYEVKTTQVGSNSIKISSIEQLDCVSTPGTLITVMLKTTTPEDSHGITLSSVIDDVYKKFQKMNAGEKFMMLMNSLNLPSSEYDIYHYNLCDLAQYHVDEDFPCLRRKDIPDSVGKVEYEIYLQSINRHRVA